MEGVHPRGILYQCQYKGVAAKGSCIVIKTKGVHFALLLRAAWHTELGWRFGRHSERAEDLMARRLRSAVVASEGSRNREHEPL